MKYLPLLLIISLMTFIALPCVDLFAKEGHKENVPLSREKDAINLKETAAEKSTESIEEELAEQSTESLEEKISKNPLSPPNTSSPRATLQGFTESMNLAYKILMEAHQKNLKTPGLRTSESVQKRVQMAEDLLKRSIGYLDLSMVPGEIRNKGKQERALMLKEILDRIEVPPFREIPDVKAIEKEEEEEKVSELYRWRLPNTDIVVERVKEGTRKGEYLFTPRTINRLEEFYNKTKHLPYKHDKEITADFYDFFIGNPGTLLPPKWGKWLPNWSTQLLFGQTIGQWISLFLLPFIALLLIWKMVIFWIAKSAELSTAIKITGWVIVVLTDVAAVMSVFYILDTHVNISGSVLVVVDNILSKFFIIFLPVIVVWEILKCNISKRPPEEEINENDDKLGAKSLNSNISEQAPEEKINEDDDEWGAKSLSRGDTLLLILRKILMIIILTTVGFLLLSAMGINIRPLLAGAGVIGIAIGFGSQKLVSDFFSGIFFLTDDAFRVGEYIQAGSVSGTVETITLRNVMLRHHRGMLQIVPYSELGPITNFMRGGIVVKFNLEFPYDADIDQIRKVIKKVGIAMLDDEQFGKDFIRPVKSQGVREITGSVMVIRVKFTAQPGTHFVIQREAFRRITEALAAQGINYAHRKVIVELPQEDETDMPPERTQKILEAGAAAELARQEDEKKPAVEQKTSI